MQASQPSAHASLKASKDALESIADFLTPKDLNTLRAVSHSQKSAIEFYWEKLLARDFPRHYFDVMRGKKKHTSFHDAYKKKIINQTKIEHFINKCRSLSPLQLAKYLASNTTYLPAIKDHYDPRGMIWMINQLSDEHKKVIYHAFIHKLGIKENNKDEQNNTIAHYMIWFNQIDLLTSLFKIHPEFLSARNNSGYTVMHAAYAVGNAEAIKIINDALQINNIVPAYTTPELWPIYFAAYYGHVFLMEQDYETDETLFQKWMALATNKEGKFVIFRLAAQNGHHTCLQFMIDAAWKLKATNPHDATLEQMLLTGWPEGGTCHALRIAAEAGHNACVKILIDAAWTLKKKNPLDKTLEIMLLDDRTAQFPSHALRIAAQNGHHKCVEYLLDAGRKLKEQNPKNTTLEKMLSAGKSLFGFREGSSAFELARKNGHHQCVSLLDPKLLKLPSVHITGNKSMPMSDFRKIIDSYRSTSMFAIFGSSTKPRSEAIRHLKTLACKATNTVSARDIAHAINHDSDARLNLFNRIHKGIAAASLKPATDTDRIIQELAGKLKC